MRKRILTIVLTLATLLGSSGSALADNEVDIDQTGSAAGGTYNVIDYANIVQIGTDNEIRIRQDSDTYNEAWVYQEGVHNKIDIDQHADNSYNYAHVFQKGTGNIAELSQTGDRNGSEPVLVCPHDPSCVDFSALNAFSTTIYDGAYVTQYQYGDDNKAYTTIIGDDNQTAQWQEGNGNYAELNIYGSNNHAKQVQLVGGNTANMTINGNDNLVGQYQEQGNQSSTITLTGDGKCVYVYGSGNWPL